MNKSNKFSPEVRERAVRMVQEHRGEYPSLWAAMESIAPKIGCVPQTLLEWVKRSGRHAAWYGHGRSRADQGAGTRGEGASACQRHLAHGQRFFRPSGARPQTEVLNAYIDEHRDAYGVEPICKVLQVAPSAYRCHAARQRNPELRSASVSSPSR